jgi:hypothetical protein
VKALAVILIMLVLIWLIFGGIFAFPRRMARQGLAGDRTVRCSSRSSVMRSIRSGIGGWRRARQ